MKNSISTIKLACKGFKNQSFFPTNYNKENKKIIDDSNLPSSKKKGCFLLCSWFSFIFFMLLKVSVIFYFWVYLFFDGLFIILREIIVFNNQMEGGVFGLTTSQKSFLYLTQLVPTLITVIFPSLIKILFFTQIFYILVIYIYVQHLSL